jgi:hypothetical protein
MYASSTQFIRIAWPASWPKTFKCAVRDFSLSPSRYLAAWAALASRSALITKNVLVSGRHQRNIMMRMGGPAPNLRSNQLMCPDSEISCQRYQYKLRQP